MTDTKTTKKTIELCEQVRFEMGCMGHGKCDLCVKNGTYYNHMCGRIMRTMKMGA